MNYQNEIRKAIMTNKHFLVTGNAIEFFGEYININEVKYPALNIFPYRVLHENYRIVGSVVMSMTGIKEKIIGFQNRCGIMIDDDRPLFKVIEGTGCYINSNKEGYWYRNFFGTYIFGPLLIRNPHFTNYLLKSIMSTKNKKYKFKIAELFSSIKKLFSVSYILTINKIMITFLGCFEAILVPIVLKKSGLSTNDALSIYGVLTGMAIPVITFPSSINTSVSTMILPTIADANTSNQKDRVKKTTEVSIWFSLVMGIFFIGIFSFYGNFIGGTIFGHPEAGEYIRTLAWLCPFMYLSITMGSILHGLGKTNIAFLHNVIGTSIRLFCLWFVVPKVGIMGYLWGLLGSELIVSLLHGYQIHKEIHFEFDVKMCIIKPSIWLTLSLVIGKLLQTILGYTSFTGKVWGFFISGVTAISILSVFLYFLARQIKDMRKPAI